MSELSPKDKWGCVKGKEKWDGHHCIAIPQEKKVSEQATDLPSDLEVTASPEGQSVKKDSTPKGTDYHAKRALLRKKVPSLRGEYKKPTVATHAVNKTYANKPLSTKSGSNVSQIKKPKVSETKARAFINHLKKQRKKKVVKKEG